MPSCLTLLHLNLPRLTALPDAGARPSLSPTGAGCSGARGRLTLKEQDPVAIQDAIRIYGPMTAGSPILAAQVLAHVTHSLDHLLGVCEGDLRPQVCGASMTGISVMDGDYVLVRPAPRVLDGEVAVVLLPARTPRRASRCTCSGIRADGGPAGSRRAAHPDPEDLTVVGRAPGTVACVMMSPRPLAHVQRQHPGRPLAVLGEDGRVR